MTIVLTPGQTRALLAVMLLVSILNTVDRQLPLILAESIKRDLHLSDTQLGLLNGLAFAVCYSTLAIPLARLADRWSAKMVLTGCLAFWSLMTALGGFSQTFAQLAATRLGVAVGEAGSTPAAHALISRSIPPERRGLALGLFTMGAPVGVGVGMAVGGWLADQAGWRVALIAAGAAGVVALVLWLALAPNPQPLASPRAQGDTLGQALGKLFRSVAFRYLFLAICLAGASSTATLAFCAPFLIRVHHMTATQVGLGFGLAQAVAGALAAVIGGRIFDARKRHGGTRALWVPAASFLLAAPLTAATWLADSGWLAMALLVPVVFAYVVYTPTTFGIAHLIAGPGNQGVASSLLMLGGSLIGASIGPLAVGALSDRLLAAHGVDGLRWALLLVPAANVLAALTFLQANRRLRREAVMNEPASQD